MCEICSNGIAPRIEMRECELLDIFMGNENEHPWDTNSRWGGMGVGRGVG